MAITIKNCDLSVLNTQLSALAGRKYQDSYTAVPNGRLPAAMIEQLGVIYTALTGTEFMLDGTTLLVSAEDGCFNRLYAPKLYANTGEVTDEMPQLYLKWGNERIALRIADGVLQPVAQSEHKVSFKFAKFNPSGRGDDPALEIKVQVRNGKDSTVFQTLVAVAAQDWGAYDPGVFQAHVETDVESFLELLAAESTGGGKQTSGEVTDIKTILAAVFGSVEEQTAPVVSNRIALENVCCAILSIDCAIASDCD